MCKLEARPVTEARVVTGVLLLVRSFTVVLVAAVTLLLGVPSFTATVSVALATSLGPLGFMHVNTLSRKVLALVPSGVFGGSLLKLM